jgi:L-Ala-D/L-Glu epimerase / N-acetyl-D-glutamate racemase
MAGAVLPAELTWFLAMTEQIVTKVPEIVDGMIELPSSPSLGSLIDWDAVEKMATTRVAPTI